MCATVHSLHFVLGEEDSDEEEELQTVVYFWQASYSNAIIFNINF